MGSGAADDVERLARGVPGWGELALRIEPIVLGITNRNFKVTLPDGRAFMMRLPGERTEVLGIDRACEAEATRRAAQLGIGPRVHRELPGVGTLVTEFIPGRHAADEVEFRQPARLGAVVELLRRFHGSGVITGRFPIHRVVEWHARDAARFGVDPPAAFGELRGCSLAIEHAFAQAPMPAMPCHNDLLPANVLFDDDAPGGPQAWLLDFEYAGMNDVFFDLANLSVNSTFTAEADERMLHAYFGTVTAAHIARLELMKIMSELREGMWAVVQQAISTIDTFDFVAYANERLAHCQDLCADAAFGNRLRDAAGAIG
jgi:thiamine kinase-like enzyme